MAKDLNRIVQEQPPGGGRVGKRRPRSFGEEIGGSLTSHGSKFWNLFAFHFRCAISPFFFPFFFCISIIAFLRSHGEDNACSSIPPFLLWYDSSLLLCLAFMRTALAWLISFLIKSLVCYSRPAIGRLTFTSAPRYTN